MILSVIVPVFNVEEYLDTCLGSICNENIDMEIIVINDHSTDSSGKICNKWAKSDNRIRVLHHDTNKGLSAARNAGIEIAQGEYITFIDSDDYISSHTLEHLIKIIEANPKIDIIEYPVKIDHGSKQSYIYIPGNGFITDFKGWITQKGFLRSYAWNKIYRRKLWKRFRFPENRLFEDMYTIPYVIRMADNIMRTNTGLYYYCKHKTSISNSLNKTTSYEILNANIKFYNEIKDSQDFSNGMLDYIYMQLCNRQIIYLEQGGNMIIPKKNISYKLILHTNYNYKEFLKYILMIFLGKKYCVVISKVRTIFKL